MYKVIAALMLLLLTALTGEVRAESGSLIKHVVVKGEVLSQIARDFKVPMSLILSADINPRLAARNAPDRIYAGETILIPRIVTSSAPITPATIEKRSSVAKAAPVARIASGSDAPVARVMTSGRGPTAALVTQIATGESSAPEVTNVIVDEAGAKATATRKEKFPSGSDYQKDPEVARAAIEPSGTAEYPWAFVVLGSLAVIIFSLGVYFLHLKKPAEKSEFEKKAAEKAPLASMTPTEIIRALGSVKATSLRQALQMQITTNEKGDAILLWQFVPFMRNAKQSWPEETLVRDLARTWNSEPASVSRIRKGEPIRAYA